jgi:hypothetical protein
MVQQHEEGKDNNSKANSVTTHWLLEHEHPNLSFLLLLAKLFSPSSKAFLFFLNTEDSLAKRSKLFPSMFLQSRQEHWSLHNEPLWKHSQ